MKSFERRHQRLASTKDFWLRMGLFALFSTGIMGLSLYGGMAGFHYLENLGWLDSLLNATMLLGGEGPLAQPQTVAGKYFASFYAVYSGVVFLVAFGVLVTPVAHRMFHLFHLPEDDPSGEPDQDSPRGQRRRRGPSRRA
jgi:hypothetical protein